MVLTVSMAVAVALVAVAWATGGLRAVPKPEPRKPVRLIDLGRYAVDVTGALLHRESGGPVTLDATLRVTDHPRRSWPDRRCCFPTVFRTRTTRRTLVNAHTSGPRQQIVREVSKAVPDGERHDVASGETNRAQRQHRGGSGHASRADVAVAVDATVIIHLFRSSDRVDPSGLPYGPGPRMPE
ncbi:MAG TPA: hypothetical protein VGD53_14075 [Actinoallomurus sp.]